MVHVWILLCFSIDLSAYVRVNERSDILFLTIKFEANYVGVEVRALLFMRIHKYTTRAAYD